MTAEVLTTTDPRWDDVRTVPAIAAGPDWQEKVRQFAAIVSPAAHKLSHPTGRVYRCPGCDPVACPWCDKPEAECESPAGHGRLHAESETPLLMGVGHYGRDGRR